jgi:glycosyltransferase involved in cell wall biosynthesis
MTKLFIISNESIFSYKGKFFCDNIDMKSTPEGLNKLFEVNLISRQSKNERIHEININNVKTYKNIFSFIYGVVKSFHQSKSKYLIISITPFTFLSCVVLALCKKKPIVYLRSDGYSEYKSILGKFGPFIYHVMFTIVSKISYFISCRKYILKGKTGDIVYPSRLNKKWFQNTKKLLINEVKLLYVGRLKIEKGIFSLIDLIKKNNQNMTLSIVGAEKNYNKSINHENIQVYEIEQNEEALIKLYDEHDIFVLPSFTEGHPMALLEALSRLRPVIIFSEIEHVIGEKKGIFVAQRTSKSFFERVKYIKENYINIQHDMKENQLPTKDDYLKKFGDLISSS